MTDWLLVGAQIHKYRGIGDVQLPLGGVTVLIGPNGSGKSSVLEALGYVTPEEGALERRGDLAPAVSWYFRPSDRSPEQVSMQEAFARALTADGSPTEGNARDAIVGMCKRSLCIRRAPGGRQVIALDMFGLLTDQLAVTRQARQRNLRARLAAVPTKIAGLIEAALDRAETPDFVDLGISWRQQIIDAPTRVSMTAVADDVSPYLLGLISVLVQHVYRDVALHVSAVAGALGSVAQGLLAPAVEAGLVTPVLKALEEEVEQCVPGFVRESGALGVALRGGPDDASGRVRGILREIALATDRPEIFELCVSAFRQLDQYGDSIDHHFECDVFDRATKQAHPYSRLGTGTRRWIFGAIDEAGRRLARTWASQPLTLEEFGLVVGANRLPNRVAPEAASCVRLIDEPLENIEGRRHGEIISWLTARREQAEERLVLSSHQASALKAGSRDSMVVVGLRRREGKVRSRAFGPGLLAGLDRHFAELGISREELLFGARALLLEIGRASCRERV